MGFRRGRDIFYAVYYLVHLPISILVDSQLIFPKRWFSPMLLAQSHQYIRDYKDPLVGNAPAWFLSSIYIEMFLMVPFFVVGIFGALKDASWMRIPSIIYGATVVTQCLPMVTYILCDKFEGSRVKPTGDSERWMIAAIYGFFFLVGATILVDNIFFRPTPREENTRRPDGKPTSFSRKTQ